MRFLGFTIQRHKKKKVVREYHSIRVRLDTGAYKRVEALARKLGTDLPTAARVLIVRALLNKYKLKHKGKRLNQRSPRIDR